MRWTTALDAGFVPERLEWAWGVLERTAGTEAVPAAVAAVGRGAVAVGPRAFGWAVWDPADARAPARTDTVFDLASLTKVVGTATACWALVERGQLRLGEPVAALLPGFAEPAEGEPAAWRAAVTVRQLLTHTSGLPAHRDLRLVAGGRQERLAAVERTPLQSPPGEAVVYSDLGFILLGRVVEVAGGGTLDDVCRRLLFQPADMGETSWLPGPALRARAAATEWVADRGDGQPGHLRGVVHDENARALGGVAGHAGLFSTATDLARFAAMLARGGLAGGRRLLAAATVAAMSRPVVLGDDDGRSLGWQTAGRRRAPYGDLWSPRAFGHTGFTGTSLWLDPDRDLWVVLLTNAVHMGRAVGLPAMPRLRACFHNAVVAALAE
jgi:CubicO group peptidase (beta-lactamase class C family)